MIFGDGIELRRGEKILFTNANFMFHARHKIGVTGSNGSGKSSFFSLLKGELFQDAGALDMQPGLVVSHVAQELPGGSRKAIDYVIDGDVELREIQSALDVAEQEQDAAKMGEYHERLATIDGYSAHARAAQLLDGLGFAKDEIEHPIDYFSGGWRMRLNLARALMCRSDLLLLDEPTNHLDLDAVIWLESWLKHFSGTLLLISHDRSFLDNVVQSICHIDRNGLKLYRGNYSDFEVQRASQMAQQKALIAKQQREADRMKAFIERFRAKATKARQAQSRIKQLRKLETVSPAHVETPFQFEFREPLSRPDPAITAQSVTLGYGVTVVLSEINFELREGARIGLLGKNGAGKSTFIRFLAGQLQAQGGEVSKSKDLKIGYFEQNSLDHLRSDESPMQHMVKLDPFAKEQEFRNYLGGFGFFGDDVFRHVELFSGGERSRLALAMIIWQKPNVLLLDEPTNHLDMQMRYALTRALQTFEGAMVLVSHDRSLLGAVCDEFRLIHDGALQFFDHDLDEYSTFLLSKSLTKKITNSETDEISRKERRRVEAEERNRSSAQRRPIEQRLKRIETKLERLNADKIELEKALAEPHLYEESEKDNLSEALWKSATVQKELDALEDEWMTLSSELESL